LFRVSFSQYGVVSGHCFVESSWEVSRNHFRSFSDRFGGHCIVPDGEIERLFNLYVALSRSSGQETICLLRDFNDQLFMQAHDPMLLAEDDRLEDLNKQTMRWWREMRSSTEMDLSVATQ
jgi:hypothetical protein